MPRVSMTVTLTGTIEQEMTPAQWAELNGRFDNEERVKIDCVDIDWTEAINALDGEIEDAEIVQDAKEGA